VDTIRARIRALPRVALVAVVALVVGSWAFAFVVVRDDGGGNGTPGAGSPAGADPADDEPPDGTACSLLTPTEVTNMLGRTAERLDGATPSTCNLRAADGTSLSLVVNPTPDAASFRALVTEADPAPLSVGDEAFWWETASPMGGVLVGRSGGTAVTITYVGDPLSVPVTPSTQSTETTDPAEETRPPLPTDAQRTEAIVARLTRAGTLVLERVERTDFTGSTGPDVAGDTCARIDLAALVAAVGLTDQHVPALAPLGTSGCTFSTATGVNLGIEALAGAYSAEQLDGLSREAVVEGEARSSRPEPQPDLADHAVWLADPVNELAGELYALYGEVAVRITSNGGGDAPTVRDRAVRAMELVGPTLTA
jgi:hypothetical protein